MLKKGERHSGTTLIMLSVIIALNLAGINYAHWEQGMVEKTKVKTGMIEAQIDSFKITGEGLEGSKDDGDLKIKGTMQEGQTATVIYSVKNKGKIPVEFGKPKVVEETGLKFDISSAVKEMNGKTGGTGQIKITACEAGDYSFKVELPYSLDVQ